MDGGRCLSDGEGDYGNVESCTIKALRPLILTATEFDTESSHDTLTIAGTAYSGSDGPQGLPVDGGAELAWSSDGSVVRAGFKVCASEPGSFAITASPVIS